MNKFTRRFAAVLATGALVAAGIALTAGAANADVIPGTIKLFTSGSAVGTIAAKQITSGSSTSNPMFYGITINGSCPAGQRDAAAIAVFQGGNKVGTLGQANTVTNDGVYGTNGLKASDTSIAMDESSTVPSQNPYVDNNVSLEGAAPTLTTGAFEIRYYCFADFTNPDFVNDKFYSLTLNFNSSTHTWAYPAVVTATTTSITGTADQVAKKITVGINIKKASDGTAATTAGGTATVNQTAPSAAVLGTATITGGVGTFTSAVLTPGTYTVTVTYSGDANFGGSASASATNTINGANSGGTTITFTVDPGSAGGLTLSNVPAAVDLGHATVNGGLLTASNATAFSGITVTDNRSIDSAAWSLTGQMGTFTNGSYTLSGNYLGWAPFVQFGPATPGGTIAPNAPGLGSSALLATAPVTNGTPVSSVGAALSVAIPQNSATGTYSGTLTITLS
jgi:hypothetical protein